MDIQGFIRVLLRRRWLILAIISVSMIITFLVAVRSPRVYSSSVRIATGIAEEQEFTGAQSPQRYEIEARYSNMEEMLRSPGVLDIISYRLMLHDLERPDPFQDLSGFRTRYGAEEIRAARERYRLKAEAMQPLLTTDELERKLIQMLRDLGYDFETLRGSLNVRRLPGTDFIELQFLSRDPYLSAFVVNTLAQEFIRYYTQVQSQRAASSVEFFAQMASEKKRELDERIREWEGYQQGQAGSSPIRQLLDPIGQLEQAREKAAQEALAAEQEIIRIQGSLPEEFRRAYISSGISRGADLGLLLRSRLSRLINQYVRGGMASGPVRDSLEITRQDWQNELLSQMRRGLDPGQEGYASQIELQVRQEVQQEVAREQMRAIDRELRRIGSLAGTLPVSNGGATPIDRELETARDAYLLALTKLNEAKLSILDPVRYNITQVSYAQPADRPEASRLPLLVALSGMVTLLLCIGTLFVLEYFDQSIRFPSRLAAWTGLPLMGSLNRMRTSNLDLVSLFSQTQQNESLESFKQLLRKIRHAIDDRPERIFLTTSTGIGVGKTSILISLGYSFSLSGRKVLLIDCNFKSNTLTQIANASPSLEKYLNKEIPRKMLVSASVFEGMDVIGCEGGNLSPSEVFRPEQMEQMLADLSQEYDYVFIEGPALNPYVDSRELLRFAEKVIPVFAADASLGSQDEASLAYLKSLGDKLLPAILNKVEPQNMPL